MTEEKETKKPMQVIQFRLHTLRPDKRQYKQQSTELMCPPNTNIMIAVEVPCTNEYIYNSAKINAAVLSTDETAPEPILTPEGLFYIHQQFEEYFSDPEETYELTEASEDEGWETDSADTWDEEETASDEVETSDDVWEDDSSGSDDSWNEDDEGWE